MIRLAEAGEHIAATTKKLEKIAIVAEYLKARTPKEASVSAAFVYSRPFPVWEEATLQVGGRVLWRIVAELSGKSEAELTAAYRQRGDLGAVAGDVLPDRPRGSNLSLVEVEGKFRQMAAARAATAKAARAPELLAKATPIEAKSLVKIMTGDLRIGLKETLVEEA